MTKKANFNSKGTNENLDDVISYKGGNKFTLRRGEKSRSLLKWYYSMKVVVEGSVYCKWYATVTVVIFKECETRLSY